MYDLTYRCAPCFLPCFARFEIIIEEENISFGYGPLECGTVVTLALSDIDKSSITSGYDSCSDNLFGFGGWGIRFGNVSVNDKKRAISVYNPSNGNFVQFFTNKGKGYRFSSQNPDKVMELIR